MTPHRTFFSSVQHRYRSRVTSELQTYVLKSLRDLLLLALEFFVENTMVQVISATPHIHMPLRDLGHELLVYLHAERVAFVGFELAVEELAVIWVLFCFAHGSKGLAVIQRGARCLAITRSLRICVFTLTVLPSPKPHCRFAGPVDPFQAQIGGVCNDLLFSGHVVIYTLTAVAFTVLCRDYANRALRYGPPAFVWLYMTQRIVRTILERHHYSIDMVVGLIITLLIWQSRVLQCDLPKVPQNLFLHLKQLVFPKSRSILKEV